MVVCQGIISGTGCINIPFAYSGVLYFADSINKGKNYIGYFLVFVGFLEFFVFSLGIGEHFVFRSSNNRFGFVRECIVSFSCGINQFLAIGRVFHLSDGFNLGNHTDSLSYVLVAYEIGEVLPACSVFVCLD